MPVPETPETPWLSIIVPTLNEEKALPETLARIARCAPSAEIVLVDGGSTDGTRAVYERFVARSAQPVRWIDSARGRGRQMNAGAAAGRGEVLLFLHADTLLPDDSERHLRRALRDPRIRGGNFRLAFTPRSALSDFYARCYNLRSRWHVFYGDSGLFVRRETFVALGGYRADRLMEDVEFIGRLRRHGGLTFLGQATVVTSARRFHGTRRGLTMLFVWLLLHALMALGVSQETLERLYPPRR
ncbi:MAG: TIGR04283 family arsenosugar biosynthesis glycosyltransferase [Capsulimonadales bacterium]|nr:TIGR04283 family arsenosugar biosynthesis glycosyltransferase [Capsulimonadales bacterium]